MSETQTANTDETLNADETVKHPFEEGLELYEQKAPYDQIIPLFEQGITLTPKDSVGYTCLAWLLILRRQGDDAQKAELFAQKAVQLDRNNYQAHFNLALAMLENGSKGVRGVFQKAMAKVGTDEDYTEVIENLKDALEREPELAAASKMLAWIEG